MITTYFNNDKDLNKRIQWVKDIVANPDLVSIFEMDSKDSARDVDLAILKALLKGQTSFYTEQGW